MRSMRVLVLLLLLSAAASVSAEEKATGKAGVNELHQLSEKLRQNAGADWTSLTEHKFADELATCTIDKEVLGHYLIQDHRFLDAFTMLLASMLVDAPTLEDRIPGAQFLGLITSKENDYFERSFEALGITAEQRQATPTDPVTMEFIRLMRNTAQSSSYAEKLAVLIVAEWSYLSWAERIVPKVQKDIPFYCKEWIDLHSGDYFRSVVAYLRGQLDSLENKLTDGQMQGVQKRFMTAVQLELRFFKSAYAANMGRARKAAAKDQL